MMEIDELLDRAAKVVETPGFWIQGELYVTCDKRITGVCAMGAIAFAMWGDEYLTVMPTVNSFANERVGHAVETLGEFLHSSVAHWNDLPDRTADEVATAMRGAAMEWRIKNAG